MNHHETRGTVTKVVDIKSSTQSFNAPKKVIDTAFTVGGIFSDFELAWLHRGAYLKVVSTTDGTLQSFWDFSSITRDTKTQIIDVIEYEITEHVGRGSSRENQICLIICYSSSKDSNKATYVSFCHPRTSKILHTVTTREKVTCMSLITSKKDHSCPITGIVKLMSGALALGTKTGNVLIMDIKGYDLVNELFSCAKKTNVYDIVQNRFSCMLVLDILKYKETEIKDKICKVDDDNYHVTVSIPIYDKKDGQDHDMIISSLMYIPEGLALAVGFKSGTFLLLDVSTLKKLFKSSSLPVPAPVVKFGFQEPCNDPQNFCYLWVLHEALNEDTCLPYVVMYGILYKKVTNSPDYGRYYKNFVHCKKRFDMDVDVEGSLYGRCVACSVVSNTPSNMLRHINTHEEDPSKINLFAMVFETWENKYDHNSHISLIVFDMNQWYKAQMPHQCYQGYMVPFMNFVLLDRVSERRSSLLDMRIKKDTIQQFLTFNLSEEYSYPSSLSFDTVFLTASKFVHLRIPGLQRSIIEQIVAEGPNCLINPNKYFTECKEVGLRPCFSDNYGHVIVPSLIQQRNYILTILLEHKISNFLVRCVNEWADGSRAVSGCSLVNFLQWAWDCVTRIKQLTDTICVPLFDYSGDDLDRENYQKLKHCSQLLQLIRDLMTYILKNFKHYLLDYKTLNEQVETLQLVTKYFEVIIWCLDVGLLPEKVTSSSDRCIPMYMASIMQYTEQRREELKVVAAKDKYFLSEECTLYIIDSILENEPGGRLLRQQWERESCGMTNGYYPSVTLQSMLRMFLMPNLSTDMKHFIMMYFLLDVCDYHRDEDMKEQLLSFSTIFFLEPKFLSLVDACWLIDREKFEGVLGMLLTDPVINFLRKNKTLYDTIIKSCVCQGQFSMALKCERIIKSTMSMANKSFYITLLLLNGLIMEAYSALRQNLYSDQKLLRNFFKVCDELGLLKEVFKFPLLPEEEEEFLHYLDTCDNKDAGDLKIMYLLSRDRYVEAIDENHTLNSKLPRRPIVGNDTTKQNSGGRTTTRDLLVNAFAKTLPAITNDLITLCRKERDKIYRHRRVEKPTPLSVDVHVDISKQVPVYKTSMETVMQTAICKTASLWKSFAKIDDGNRSLVRNTPFLRSEIMMPKKRDDSFRLNETKPKDADEPPTKRRKTDISPETSPKSLDVSKILRTPHIQKRLNKLLENTPESSPLTSILKSSDMSRFKQPQKVGFSVPEVHRRQRKDNGNVSIYKADESIEYPRRSLVEDFERSQQTQTERNDFSITSVNSSDTVESYYSLENAHDENIINFGAEEPKVNTNTTNMYIECMSDEDIQIPVAETITETAQCTVQSRPIEEPLVEDTHMVEVSQPMAELIAEESQPVELQSAEPRTMDVLQMAEESHPAADTETVYSTENQHQIEDENNAVGVITSTFEYNDDVYHRYYDEHEANDRAVEYREVDEECKKNGYSDDEKTQDKASSVTEISESSEDSDIEIIESNATPVIQTSHVRDDVSEKTYESEYTYSDGSLAEESEPEQCEENVYVDDSNDVEYDNEVEYEDVKTDEDNDDDSSKADVFEEEFYQNTQIDFEQLKNIVAAAEANATETYADRSNVEESIDENVSVSICEVFDTTQSASVNVSEANTGDAGNTEYSIVNVSSVTDTKVEDKSKDTSEPSLVFYFGENSVNSIGENVLMDEHDVSAAKNTIATEPEQYSNVLEEEKFTKTFLRTSLPECNVHYIEKVRNEMYSSDDGYDDSDVQPEQTSDENHDTDISRYQTVAVNVDVRASFDRRPGENDENVAVEVNVGAFGDNLDARAAREDENHGTAVTDKNEPVDGRDTEIDAIDCEKDISVDVSIVHVSSQPDPVVERVENDAGNVFVSPVMEIKRCDSMFTRNETPIQDTTPRRSARIARRRSIDNIATAADNDDAISVKSASSVDSLVSRESTRSKGSRKSYSRMELRKSTNKHNFKQLEVILSDEEMTPSKQPEYAASEPDKGRKTQKRKRSTRSETDADNLSTISETDTKMKNVRRKSQQFEKNIPQDKKFGKFVSSTPLVKKQKASEMSAAVEEYANTRRLTRTQQKYLEYGLSNSKSLDRDLPSSSGVTRAEKFEEIDENESDYSLQIDEDDKNSSPQKPIEPDIKPPRRRNAAKDRTRTRFSHRLSARFDNDDSMSSEPPSPAKSISSVAESTSSKASTVSRQSRGRRSYTSLELRKSSVRANFKPLAVIPSDDESQSFQQPQAKTGESSPSSTISRTSTESKTRRSARINICASDRDSSVSDVSSIASSVGSRKKAKKKTEKSEPSSVAAYTSNRRLTRNQKSKLETTLKDNSKMKKK